MLVNYRKKNGKAEEPAAPASRMEAVESVEFGTPREVTIDPADILNPDGSLSIQIASDIHLEFYSEGEEIPQLLIPSAPVLALLGDIGNPVLPNYRDFLCKQAAR